MTGYHPKRPAPQGPIRALTVAYRPEKDWAVSWEREVSLRGPPEWRVRVLLSVHTVGYCRFDCRFKAADSGMVWCEERQIVRSINGLDGFLPGFHFLLIGLTSRRCLALPSQAWH